MAERERLICASTALAECGTGVRFVVPRDGDALPAFVVRFDGVARAYVNQCAHVGVELDWMEGEFFDSARRHLICATHGATYAPENGHCVAGPCKGARLIPLLVTEHDGQVWLIEGKANGQIDA